MAIDGLIILDSLGRPVIQSGYTSHPPAYPILHIDALNTALSKATRPEDIDPVLYVVPAIGEEGSACCHVEIGGLRLLASVSGDADPLVAFSFLRAFRDILIDYFGTVNVTTLKDNFDIVYQLLEETLDPSGYPLTTSPDALRDIVLPPSLFSKLLASLSTPASSSTWQGGIAGNGVNAALSSPIPWRKMGIKHNHNEILFDVVEDIQAIVGRNGATIVSNVWGKIEANAKLSGTPDLTFTFTNPKVLMDCAFHPCVRLQRWSRDHSFSFIPPDGRFVLAEYRYAPPQSVAAGAGSVPVPLALKTVVDIGEFGGTLSLTLSSRLSTKVMENIEVEIYLGDDASGAQCAASSSGTGTTGADGGGSWTFDPRRKVLRWEILAMRTSGSWMLRGSWTSKAKAPRPARAFQIRFDLPSYSFSALKVDHLRLSGENYKTYKGMRGRSRGSIEWRW